MKSWCVSILLIGALLAGSGCRGKGREISELHRKEAAHLASEAEFALNLKDWTRAEGLMTQVVKLSPDRGAYWVSLGSLRARLNNRSGARDAYKGALEAYEEEARVNARDFDPWLQQVYVLALMSRVDDSRKLLDKVAKRFPEDRNVRAFVEGKQFEAMLADPLFKQMAL